MLKYRRRIYFQYYSFEEILSKCFSPALCKNAKESFSTSFTQIFIAGNLGTWLAVPMRRNPQQSLLLLHDTCTKTSKNFPTYNILLWLCNWIQLPHLIVLPLRPYRKQPARFCMHFTAAYFRSFLAKLRSHVLHLFMYLFILKTRNQVITEIAKY